MKVRIRAGHHEVESQVLGLVATGPMHHIELVISWDGNRPARLTEVRDNSKLLPIVQTTGTGRIIVSYDTPVDSAHYIECVLEFPGRSLKDLKVTGRIDGGEDKVVDSEKERPDRWHAEGTLS